MIFRKLTFVLPAVVLAVCGCRSTSNRTSYCAQPAVVAAVPAPPPPCATAIVPAPPPGFVR